MKNGSSMILAYDYYLCDYMILYDYNMGVYYKKTP